MMLIGILMVLLVLLGAPLFSVIAAGAFWNFHQAEIDLQAIAIEFYGIAEMPILLAIPLFTFPVTCSAKAMPQNDWSD